MFLNKLFYLFFEKAAFSIWRYWLEQLFRSYVRLNYNYGTKIRKQDSYIYRGKIPSDNFGSR